MGLVKVQAVRDGNLHRLHVRAAVVLRMTGQAAVPGQHLLQLRARKSLLASSIVLRAQPPEHSRPARGVVPQIVERIMRPARIGVVVHRLGHVPGRLARHALPHKGPLVSSVKQSLPDLVKSPATWPHVHRRQPFAVVADHSGVKNQLAPPRQPSLGVDRCTRVTGALE